MQTQDESCLVRRFSHYVELESRDKTLLRELEYPAKTVRRGETLGETGDRAQYLYTIHAGWAHSYGTLVDGGRQILEFYLPGDIVGLRHFAFTRCQTSAVMITDGVVCPFALGDLLKIFERSTALTALLFAFAAQEQGLLVNRLINLGRHRADESLANLIAELYGRLRRINPYLEHTMPLPIPQTMLADALGLSTVHMSRTCSELRQRGLFDKHAMHAEIPDIKRLAGFGQFTDEILDSDIHHYLAALAQV